MFAMQRYGSAGGETVGQIAHSFVLREGFGDALPANSTSAKNLDVASVADDHILAASAEQMESALFHFLAKRPETPVLEDICLAAPNKAAFIHGAGLKDLIYPTHLTILRFLKSSPRKGAPLPSYMRNKKRDKPRAS
jgi:hypothetical protein